MVNRKIINLQHLQISYDEIKHSNLKQKDLHNLSKLEKTNIKNLEIIKELYKNDNDYSVLMKLIKKIKPSNIILFGMGGSSLGTKAIVDALESGKLAGYAGDVWFPQPAPQDHPWRTMPNHGMTPHTSGTSLSAQTRYAAGVREILECYLDNKPIRDEYLIVQGGALAGVGARSYTEGNATDGSEKAGT